MEWTRGTGKAYEVKDNSEYELVDIINALPLYHVDGPLVLSYTNFLNQWIKSDTFAKNSYSKVRRLSELFEIQKVRVYNRYHIKRFADMLAENDRNYSANGMSESKNYYEYKKEFDIVRDDNLMYYV